jgi:hypothetical protein
MGPWEACFSSKEAVRHQEDFRAALPDIPRRRSLGGMDFPRLPLPL